MGISAALRVRSRSQIIRTVDIVSGEPYQVLVIPLGIPALVIAGPTLFFWRRSRRPPAGYCRKCGYNLTGLPEPRCPECGTEFDPATVPRAVGTDADET